MKLNHPARLGVFVALLSSRVASQEVSMAMPCSTIEDCPENMYCSSVSEICLEMSTCMDVSDCNDPTNLYALAFCMGTKFCEDGKCGIDCTQIPPEEGDGVVGTGECITDSDCKKGPEEMYCAGDGICEPMGGCADVEDCYSESNIFPSITCTGKMDCEDRRCFMKCDASDKCETTADCPDTNSYCSTDGYCLPNGSCSIEKDCFAEGNIYAVILCEGKTTCEDGMCGVKCGEFDEPSCTTSDDCEEEETYCSGNGTCLPMGGCDRVADCNNPDNFFFSIECVGKQTCEEGMCGVKCGEFDEPSCTTSDDCKGEETYCAGNGTCLPMGGCDLVEDCSSPDNFFMLADCVGQRTCEEGFCGIKCDEFCTTSADCTGESYCAGNGKCLPMGGCDNVEDCNIRENSPLILPSCLGEIICEKGGCSIACESTPVNEAPPVELGVECMQDSDCAITTSTTRSSEGVAQYCMQGVCTEHGSCIIDSDCNNPSNFLWHDKRCAGYLYCTEGGKCDRECGVDCKNGSKAAQCLADPCSIETCPGAVSCFPSYCEGGCRAEYFDAIGKVLNCGFEAMEDSMTAGKDSGKAAEKGQFCTSSNDCSGETYCAGNRKCLPMGFCDNIEDCANGDNFFMLATCVGETTCEGGLCGIACASTEDINMSIESAAAGSSVSLSAVLVAVLVAAVFV